MRTIRNKRYYRLILWIGFAIILIAIIGLGSNIVNLYDWLQFDDYVEYWAAGQLNINGGNPYHPDQLLPLQLEAGRFEGVPVMMWNPPWLLTLVMPFSVIPYTISRILWILFFVVVVLISVNQSWILYGGSHDTRWISWIIGFTFIPVLEAIKTGQTGPLLLLGVVGFLYFLRRENYWLSGASLVLLTVKPHILYLFLFAVALWCIYRRQWLVILGFGIAIAVATFAAWIINPEVIDQYLYATTHYPPSDWATPTIGGISRWIFGINKFWLQFLAPILGMSWLLYYWIRNRRTWDWFKQAPMIVLVSVFTAAYGWTSDQSVALIAIIQLAIMLIPLRFDSKTKFIVSTYLLIEIILIIPFGNQLWNFWLAPSLLIWYLASKQAISKSDYLTRQTGQN